MAQSDGVWLMDAAEIWVAPAEEGTDSEWELAMSPE